MLWLAFLGVWRGFPLNPLKVRSAFSRSEDSLVNKQVFPANSTNPSWIAEERCSAHDRLPLEKFRARGLVSTSLGAHIVSPQKTHSMCTRHQFALHLAAHQGIYASIAIHVCIHTYMHTFIHKILYMEIYIYIYRCGIVCICPFT